MNTISLPFSILEVKIKFDRSNPNEVHKAARTLIPSIPPHELPHEVLMKHFIPEGADPVHWARVLKRVGNSLNREKKAKPDRRSQGTNRKYSPAQAIIWRDATVMGVA